MAESVVDELEAGKVEQHRVEGAIDRRSIFQALDCTRFERIAVEEARQIVVTGRIAQVQHRLELFRNIADSTDHHGFAALGILDELRDYPGLSSLAPPAHDLRGEIEVLPCPAGLQIERFDALAFMRGVKLEGYRRASSDAADPAP
jgi:hypothetical protein